MIRRGTVITCALVLAIVVAACGPGAEQDARTAAGEVRVTVPSVEGRRTYIEPTNGWSVTYPNGFHVRRIDEYQSGVSTRGTMLSSFVPSAGPFATVLAALPRDGVAFLLTRVDGGPAKAYSDDDARFPLSLDEFKPRRIGGGAKKILARYFVANGWDYNLAVWTGPDAGALIREQLAEIVVSLRFPTLQTGTTTGPGFLVLEARGAYPTGSVTRLDGFYLIHAPGGFYALSWVNRRPCGAADGGDVEFVAARLEFVCRKNGARWDRLGREVAGPRAGSGVRGRPLDFVGANVSHDDHVLVNTSLAGVATDAIYRQLWR